MKKFLLIVISIFLYCIPAFAEYIPIPKHLSKQYKAEMEQIIDEEYPKAIKTIDKYIKAGTKYYNRVLKDGCFSDNEMNVINLNLMYEHETGAVLHIYAKLLEVTQKKYLKQDFEPLGTDFSESFIDYLEPYFKSNNVNTQKIDNITKYEIEKYKILKNYNIRVNKLCPND